MATAEAHDTQVDSTAVLTVLAGNTMSTFTPDKSPVIIGRGDPDANPQPAVRVGGDGISRHHLIVEYNDGQWIGRDNNSRNGTFINREPVQSFTLADGRIDIYLAHPTRGEVVTLTTYDPANVYVGALVAKARQDKGISQRGIADEKLVSAGTLIAVEKGRAWPREATQRSIEDILGWRPGEIARLRKQYDRTQSVISLGGDGELTEQLVARKTAAVAASTGESATSASVDAGYLAEWVQTSLQSATERMDRLPAPVNPTFLAEAAPVLDELNRLEALALKASNVSPQLRAVFFKVHQQRRNLMLAAAQAPNAPIGYRLFAARDRARLSAQDAAMLAGIPPEAITAAENGHHLAEPETQALQQLLALLG